MYYDKKFIMIKTHRRTRYRTGQILGLHPGTFDRAGRCPYTRPPGY